MFGSKLVSNLMLLRGCGASKWGLGGSSYVTEGIPQRGPTVASSFSFVCSPDTQGNQFPQLHVLTVMGQHARDSSKKAYRLESEPSNAESQNELFHF